MTRTHRAPKTRATAPPQHWSVTKNRMVYDRPVHKNLTKQADMQREAMRKEAQIAYFMRLESRLNITIDVLE